MSTVATIAGALRDGDLTALGGGLSYAEITALLP
jgi:hypothetical protein